MTTPRSTKLARAKERLFRGVATIDTKKGLFVPLPMLFRVVLHKFSPREWQVLSWIYLNCRKESVCNFTLDELGSGIDYKSKSKLRVMLRDLEAKFWIVRREERGTEYYLVRDPQEAILLNLRTGNLDQADRDAVDEFLALMKRDALEGEATSEKEEA